MPKHLIIVGGPTASGKTETAIRLAEHFGTEVISADSRQFYREMSIGTAKPSPQELSRVKHHFIDTLSVTDAYSVGHFEKDALDLLKKLFLVHDIVVVAGGSGLFINALCNGLDHFPEVTEEVKIRVDEGIAQGGLPWLQSKVAALDAVYFAKVDPQNPARLRRALEVMWSGGAAYSSYVKGVPDERDFEIHQILLDWPRPQLYDRINQRVDQMVLAGLEAEAHAVAASAFAGATYCGVRRMVSILRWIADERGNNRQNKTAFPKLCQATNDMVSEIWAMGNI